MPCLQITTEGGGGGAGGENAKNRLRTDCYCVGYTFYDLFSMARLLNRYRIFTAS